jgi:hypothetical protein
MRASKSQVKRLLRILNRQDGPVTANYLNEQMGLPWHVNGWHARMVVRDAIEQGYPIVSNVHGFWLPKTGSEIRGYIARLESRIDGINSRINDLNTYLATR